MRWTGIAVIVALLGGLVVAGLAPEAAAQGRAGRSATVGVPSAGQNVSTVTPGGPPARGGAVMPSGGQAVRAGMSPPSTPGAAVSVPSATQELLIVGPGGSSTRVTIEQLPAPAAASGASRTQSAASEPSFSRETHVTVERDGTRQEFQIFSNGPTIEMPIGIFPD